LFPHFSAVRERFHFLGITIAFDGDLRERIYDRAKKRKKAHAVTGSNSANRYLSIGGDTIVQ
jgi:hypothetical protein